MQLVKKDNEKERHKQLFQRAMKLKKRETELWEKIKLECQRSFLARLCSKAFLLWAEWKRDTKGVLITLLHCLDLRSFVCSD